MTEHKICKGCKWNNYPECQGTKMHDGSWMNIEKLRPGFNCGVKDSLTIVDHKIKTSPTKEELELKIEDLQNQINQLKVV